MDQPVSHITKAPVVVRPARLDDAAAIAYLGSNTFSTTFGYSMPAADLETYLQATYTPSSITSDLSNPLMHTFVACDSQDRVLGFVQLTEGTSDTCVETAESPIIELQRLYVEPASHGLGVGKALEEVAEDTAATMGFKTIWLGVWVENFRAQKIYERFGFRKVGSHDFKMGECVQRDEVMMKALRPA